MPTFEVYHTFNENTATEVKVPLSRRLAKIQGVVEQNVLCCRSYLLNELLIYNECMLS